MPCCGAEPAGAPAILTQRAARGESGWATLEAQFSRLPSSRRRLMSGNSCHCRPGSSSLSRPSAVASRGSQRCRGAENPQNSRDLDTNKDYDTGGTGQVRFLLMVHSLTPPQYNRLSPGFFMRMIVRAWGPAPGQALAF